MQQMMGASILLVNQGQQLGVKYLVQAKKPLEECV